MRNIVVLVTEITLLLLLLRLSMETKFVRIEDQVDALEIENVSLITRSVHCARICALSSPCTYIRYISTNNICLLLTGLRNETIFTGTSTGLKDVSTFAVSCGVVKNVLDVFLHGAYLRIVFMIQNSI